MTSASPQTCLLTVIFPVFDVRGDIVERVRLWTEKQDFERHRYCVFVVAGPEAKVDGTRLRNVLQSQDASCACRLRDGTRTTGTNGGAQVDDAVAALRGNFHGLPARDQPVHAGIMEVMQNRDKPASATSRYKATANIA